MPAIIRQTSLAAGVSNPNLLSGSVFEFARRNVLLVMGVTATVTGSFITINAGADVVLEESPPFVLATPPVIPDHMQFAAVAQTGDRIVIAARNPTAGAIVFNSLVQITNT